MPTFLFKLKYDICVIFGLIYKDIFNKLELKNYDNKVMILKIK
jgi:hypothetical protein